MCHMEEIFCCLEHTRLGLGLGLGLKLVVGLGLGFGLGLGLELGLGLDYTGTSTAEAPHAAWSAFDPSAATKDFCENSTCDGRRAAEVTCQRLRAVVWCDERQYADLIRRCRLPW